MNKQHPLQPPESESFVNLLQSANAAENSVLVAYNNWLPNRKEAIRRLNSLANTLDEYHGTSNKFSLAGSTASAIGGWLFIAGLAFAPLTAGASAAALTTVGAVASTAGSATSIISSLADMGITRSTCSSVQMIVDNDKKYTNDLIAKLEKFDSIRDELISFIKTTPFTDEDLMKLATKTTIHCKKTMIGKIVLATICTLIVNIPKVSLKIANFMNTMGFKDGALFLKRLTGMGDNALVVCKQVFRAPAKLAKVVRIGLGITAGFSFVLDIWTVVSVIEDMEKGSKTETGKKFREVASDMESGKKIMENVISQWKSDYPGLAPWGNEATEK